MGALYGANTLGAATGALATGYVLLQDVLGVTYDDALAVALNLLVALAALGARRTTSDVSAEASAGDDAEPGGGAQAACLGVGRPRRRGAGDSPSSTRTRRGRGK